MAIVFCDFHGVHWEYNPLPNTFSRTNRPSTEAWSVTSVFEFPDSSPEKSISITDLKNALDVVVLGVTDACNLNCPYCYISKGTTFIEEDVALKVVDFYARFLDGTGRAPIFAFGTGEPLLAFQRIKLILKHAFRAFGIHVPSTFTTNGVLLTDDVLSFAEENDIAIAFSIDGPRPVHDQYRIGISGEPTFDLVYNALEKIYYKFPGLLKNAVVSFTIHGNRTKQDLSNLSDWFNNQFSRVTLIGSFSGERNCQQHTNMIAQRLFDKIVTNTSRVFELALLGDTLRRIHREMKETPENPSGELGCCFPGKRSFVHPDGSIGLCDRKNTVPLIGHIDSGYNLTCLHELILGFRKKIERLRCLNCWAYRFCSACYLTDLSAPEQSSLVGPRFCEEERSRILSSMKAYVSIFAHALQSGEDPWDVLDRDFSTVNGKIG